MTYVHDNIRAIRLMRHFSQEYVAESLEISQSAYGKLERGETVLSYQKLKRIAEVLDTSVYEIENFDRKKPRLDGTEDAAGPNSRDQSLEAANAILQQKVRNSEELIKSLHNTIAAKEEVIELLRGQLADCQKNLREEDN